MQNNQLLIKTCEFICIIVMTKTPIDHNFTEVAYLQLVNEYAHTWIDMCIY